MIRFLKALARLFRSTEHIIVGLVFIFLLTTTVWLFCKFWFVRVFILIVILFRIFVLFYIKYLKRIRNRTDFTTEAGAKKIKKINKTIDYLNGY